MTTDTPSSDRSRPARARRALALVALLALAGLASLLGVDVAGQLGEWPFGEPLTSGDNYSAVLHDTPSVYSHNMRLGLTLRQLVDVRGLEALVVPDKLDLLRAPVSHWATPTQTFHPPYVADLLMGKVETARYDPVLSNERIAGLEDDGYLSRHDYGILVASAIPETGARLVLFTDPARELAIVLTEEMATARSGA